MNAVRKVLVVGSGGREHALALRLLASDSIDTVIACPGNPGMLEVPTDLARKKLVLRDGNPVDVAVAEGVDFVVVGPEIPLCAGLADDLRAKGVLCYGPSKAAARLEGSKAFMKAFCARHGIRSAREVVVDRLADLEAGLGTFTEPPVVKADGLCAGKGVVVAESFEEAREAATRMLTGEAFGAAGTTIVLEERIVGEEASVHALCDGTRAFVLPVAQDHKRIFDGDRGPNTGGMGTYAPAPVVTPALAAHIEREVMQRAVDGMARDGTPFVGTLFAGVMITKSGEVVVLEYNVRFGDPETQVLTMVLDGDFGEALYGAARGHLEPGLLRVSSEHAVCVVLAAEGYPENPTKGDEIVGIDEAASLSGVRVLHAGTARKDGHLVTAGGRVLGVAARGADLRSARDLAYAAAERIRFRGRQMRGDIAHRALGPARPSGPGDSPA